MSERGTDRVRIEGVETLSDNWGVLRRYRLRYVRSDGGVQEMSREVYGRGDGAVILLYNRTRRSVLLTRQFRLSAFINQHPDGMLLEAPAGQLDDDHPVEAIKRETEEETGYRIAHVKPLFEAFMSPGSLTEKLYFFAAEFSDGDRVGAGGGHAGEGEDIEIVETTLDEAIAMIGRGEIIDAKTILLLYYARATKLLD